MSPKGRILLAFGIIASFGVSVSVVIIAIGGGFYAPPSSLLHPPTPADVWTVGEEIHPGTILKYGLTRIGNHSSPWSSLGGHYSLVNAIVTMDFAKSEGNAWSVIFDVNNGATAKVFTVLLSKQQLTNAGPINKDIVSFYEPIESSLLEIRDISLQPNYLAIGAEWNSLTIGPIGSTISARIIAQERLQTPAGTFDTSVLGYTIGSNASRIWLSHNLPLPVKAEVYNAQNELQYKYYLLSRK
ncbi:MAG TPA: hypothetical protein VFI73_09915 [Candidatus Nitrosopolaris sp.]|nr:hypothetical protein [Candidatus Nitrosopolaris sp.]